MTPAPFDTDMIGGGVMDYFKNFSDWFMGLSWGKRTEKLITSKKFNPDNIYKV